MSKIKESAAVQQYISWRRTVFGSLIGLLLKGGLPKRFEQMMMQVLLLQKVKVIMAGLLV